MSFFLHVKRFSRESTDRRTDRRDQFYTLGRWGGREWRMDMLPAYPSFRYDNNKGLKNAFFVIHNSYQLFIIPISSSNIMLDGKPGEKVFLSSLCYGGRMRWKSYMYRPPCKNAHCTIKLVQSDWAFHVNQLKSREILDLILGAHQLERRPILSKVFAPVRENDITKAKTLECLGKRTSLKLFLQWDVMNLYHSEEEFSQTVLKYLDYNSPSSS